MAVARAAGIVFDRGPIIPVIVINGADDAVPLARALVAGGLSALEVTLRTPAAPAAIEAIAKHVPEAAAPDFLALPGVPVCGGTWLTPTDLVASGDWNAITELALRASALC